MGIAAGKKPRFPYRPSSHWKPSLWTKDSNSGSIAIKIHEMHLNNRSFKGSLETTRQHVCALAHSLLMGAPQATSFNTPAFRNTSLRHTGANGVAAGVGGRVMTPHEFRFRDIAQPTRPMSPHLCRPPRPTSLEAPVRPSCLRADVACSQMGKTPHGDSIAGPILCRVECVAVCVALS